MKRKPDHLYFDLSDELKELILAEYDRLMKFHKPFIGLSDFMRGINKKGDISGAKTNT